MTDGSVAHFLSKSLAEPQCLSQHWEGPLPRTWSDGAGLGQKKSQQKQRRKQRDPLTRIIQPELWYALLQVVCVNMGKFQTDKCRDGARSMAVEPF